MQIRYLYLWTSVFSNNNLVFISCRQWQSGGGEVNSGVVYAGQQEECFNQEAGSSAASVRHLCTHSAENMYSMNCRIYTAIFPLHKTI